MGRPAELTDVERDSSSDLVDRPRTWVPPSPGYDPTPTMGDVFRAELSTDGGSNWTLMEQLPAGSGGWVAHTVDLFALATPTEDMRLRFTASDGVDDGPVEAGVDEVQVSGTWVDCQDHTPPASSGD